MSATLTNGADTSGEMTQAAGGTSVYARKALVALRTEPEGWFGAARARLSAMAQRASNWDSYGARAVDARAIQYATDILDHLSRVVGVVAPAIGGSPDGGVSLSWDAGTWNLDVVITGDGLITYAYLDERDNANNRESRTRDPARLIGLLTRWP